jgi:Optic atrophy 3 protein (OPA3)
MFPVFKLVSLAVRLFSRPAVELMKRIHNSRVSRHSRFSKFLIWLGNKQYHWKIHMDKYLLNIRTDQDMFLQGLKNEVALEKGIHFFYESLFYMVVINAATLETYWIMKETKANRKKQEERIQKSSDELDRIIQMADDIIHEDVILQLSFDRNLSEASKVVHTVNKLSTQIMEREKGMAANLMARKKEHLHIKQEQSELLKWTKSP